MDDTEVDNWLRAYAEGLHTPQAVNERLAAALLDNDMLKLAARALQGEFSDFDSPHATPKMELVQAILAAPYGGPLPDKVVRQSLIERVKGGEFDG